MTDPETIKSASRLFNPAFLTLLLARSAKGASDVSDVNGLEFPLAFVAVPLVMHPASRDALPYSSATSLLTWAQGDGQQVLLDLPGRARAMVEPTKTAIDFALRHQVLTLDGNLLVASGDTATRNLPSALGTNDARDCLSKATKVGKMFGKAGTAAFVYSTLGLRP